MKNDELKAWRVRLGLGEAGMAAYLGVPVTTYRKWENGTRSQDASTLRLFEVLQLLDGDRFVTCRRMHDELLDTARAAGPTEAPKRRGRKPRAQVSPPAAPAQPVAPSTEIPAWLMMSMAA